MKYTKPLPEPRFNEDAIEGYRQALNDLIHERNHPSLHKDLMTMGARNMRVPKGRGRRMHSRRMLEWRLGYHAGLLAAMVTIHDDLPIIFRARALWLRLR